MFTIEARNIYTPKPIPTAQVICIDHDRIIHIGQTCDQPENKVFNLSDFDVVPGFIEMQINGAFGKDFSQEPSAIWDVGARLLELGITTFLPTIITSPVGAIPKAMAVWQAGPPAGYRGAHIPGLHLEGPYLNPLKKGAHREQFFRQPALSEISAWTRENGVRMVTIAPELPGALSIIRALASRGILVSAGHSMATAKEMAIAIEAGIQCGTHIFNAMRPLDHREPGIAGILLSDDRLKVGVIVDGVHISPEIIKVIYRSKGETGFFLVSDAMAALGMSPGKYQLASREVRVNEKSALLENDILAGSILTPAESLRNFQVFSACDLSQALMGWTSNPAELLGLDEKGAVRAGALADLVVLDDHGRVAATFINGEMVYQAPWADFQIPLNS